MDYPIFQSCISFLFSISLVLVFLLDHWSTWVASVQKKAISHMDDMSRRKWKSYSFFEDRDYFQYYQLSIVICQIS